MRRLLKRMFSQTNWTQEYFDSPEVVEAKVKQVAELLKNCKHSIAFCGAGLSTLSGIPDYRSGYQTVLPTGPGKWESEENKAKYGKVKVKKRAQEAWPNYAHLALAGLVKGGYLKFVISQNVDGLLPRSGIKDQHISELHGNIFTEQCTACDKRFWRDFAIPNWETQNHVTGRNCDCEHQKPLHDTMIYFGNSLRSQEIAKCIEQIKEADFCLVVGSSLRVQPATSFVEHFLHNKGKNSLAIVNLQKTDLHGQKAIEVHSLCDQFLLKLVKELGVELPHTKINRSLHLLPLVDSDGYLLTFMDDHGRQVQASHNFTLVSPTGSTKLLERWPFELSSKDLAHYSTVRYSLIVDQSSHEQSLASLLGEHSHHSVEYIPETLLQ